MSVGWGTRWQVSKECCMDVESAGFKKFLSHVPSSADMWDETVSAEKAFKDMGELKYQLMGMAAIAKENVWESNVDKFQGTASGSSNQSIGMLMNEPDITLIKNQNPNYCKLLESSKALSTGIPKMEKLEKDFKNLMPSLRARSKTELEVATIRDKAI